MPRRIRDPNVAQTLEELRQVVIDHHKILNPLYSQQSGNYTSNAVVGFEFIDLTGAGQTVTLHDAPFDGQRKHIKNKGSGAATITPGTGDTIDGNASVQIGVGVGLQLFYLEDASDWRLI